MNRRIRVPAAAPPPIQVARAHDSDPGPALVRHYERVWQTQMHDLPFLNPALTVAGTAFQRVSGDWLGVVVTPWFISLFLQRGGGTLWQDTASGERRAVSLPCGELSFIASDEPGLGPLQYCTLLSPVNQLPDMATAMQTAHDALRQVLTAPAAETTAGGAAGAAGAPRPSAAVPTGTPHQQIDPAKRRFFRTLAGRS